MRNYIIIGAIVLSLIIVYQVFYNRFSRDLAKNLYGDLNPDLYIRQLESWKGKLFISKNRRLFLKLDALAYQDNFKGVVDVFKELESRRLSYGQKINLYDKEIQYYIDIKDFDKAKAKFELLKIDGSKINDKNMQYLLDNAEALIEIYCNHNGDYAKKMVLAADNSNANISKATYYYRAAKCYYYLDDKNNITKYLKKARNNAGNNKFGQHIDSCMEDIKNIEKM